jgi:hypothetical protein
MLVMGPGYGWAQVGTYTSELVPNAPGQTFWGDGAIYVNGYLGVPAHNPTGNKCLECHQAAAPVASDMSSYLRTGHGNMLKKVTAPPQIWYGANQQPYLHDASGHPIDWATGTVDLEGWCDVGGFEGQFEKDVCEATTRCTLDASKYPATYTTQSACETAGGTWKAGTWTAGHRPVPIISFIGDWMSVDAPDTGIMGGDLPADKYFMADGRTYGTCGSCHNAGYKANDYTRPQPFTDYTNLARSSAAGVGGSWVLNGIQCERCHDASTHVPDPITNAASVPANANSTAVCSQCHIRPAAWEGSANPNAATQPTAYPIGASATNFGSHLIGKQFLNSPHGRFTGAYAEIATALAKYNSAFSPNGEQGGCDTCHDVHQSTVPEAKVNFGAEPIKPGRGCSDCHTTEAGNLTIHPSGDGTPFPTGTGTDLPGACVVCHMPKPGGTGLNTHVFRINTDPDYATFPKQVAGVWTPGFCSDPANTTYAACIAAGKSWSGVAASSPDNTGFAGAVWNDLDLACGQCHGAKGTAHLMSKGIVAAYAQGMHTGSITTSACSDCHSSTAAVHPAGAGTPGGCSDCHGTTRAGVVPTTEAACLTCHGPTGTAAHQFTAAQLGSYSAAMHAGGPTPSTTCTTCHVEIPPDLINHVADKTCTDCHQTTAGARPGVKPTVAQSCNKCHFPGGSKSASTLAQRAAKIHKNVAPVANLELVAVDVDPVKSGIQVEIGDTVAVIDTSTDQNQNLSYIKINWGDTTTWWVIDYMAPGETATHSYATKGTKTITLTAFDQRGLKSNKKVTITVVKPVANPSPIAKR